MNRQDEETPVDGTFTDPIPRATRRLSEMQGRGIALYEILGGEAGANFIRDYCEGDPEIAYAAITLVYSPSSASAG